MSNIEDEISSLRQRVSYLEDALEAIRQGDVDAMVGPEDDQQVYSLVSADRPYRAIVEEMGQGAATTSATGVILFANQQLASMLGVGRDDLVGRDLASFAPAGGAELARLLEVTMYDTRRAELVFGRPGDPAAPVPALVAATALDIDGEQLRCLIVTDLSARKREELRQAEEAAREIQRRSRLRLAREVNDSIVQGLVAAEMELDLGRVHGARATVARTSAQARTWIGELVEGDRLQPGMAVRTTPSEPTRGSPS